MEDAKPMKTPMHPSTTLGLDEKSTKVESTMCRGMVGSLLYCDADYAGDKSERKSTSEGCHFFGCYLVSWTSKRKSTIALSTCEAEYVATGQCLTQLLWIKHQLEDYDIYESSIPVLCDNTTTINIPKNPILHSRTKHIEIKHHFIRYHVQKGTFDLIYVETECQLADIFTKPLQEDRYVWLRDRLGMELIDDQ
uniref:Copia protein n=1 Tax=Cajanus cajan TaxID=3821 RepID=A0A151SXA1_CAJCA|nr:Copia protein [Cajanus cajan]